MTTLPKSSYLQKMTTIMGKTIWQTRYFVLLETEIRYYKDEYEATPNHIICLKDIYTIKEIPGIHQKYCLSLEPNMNSKRSKPLVLGFTEKFELESWMNAIQTRLNKFISFSTTTITTQTTDEESLLLLDPITTKSSLSRRRGVILSDLEIKQIPHLISSSMSTTPSSTNSSHFSLSDDQDDTLILHNKNEDHSPTFLQYSSQFHLAMD
ncbi:unnamed protein product [Cunninghamella echinulata]